MIKRAFAPYSNTCLVLGNQAIERAIFKNPLHCPFISEGDKAVWKWQGWWGSGRLPPAAPAHRRAVRPSEHGLPRRLRSDRSSLLLLTLDKGKGLKLVKWWKKQGKKMGKEGNRTEGRTGGRESGWSASPFSKTESRRVVNWKFRVSLPQTAF